MAIKHGLGRGLNSLIKNGTAPQIPQARPQAQPPAPQAGTTKVLISNIQKNPMQPRKKFDREALADLTASVKDRGVLQPLIVRRLGNSFELIAGERRLRAATEAGLKEVPVTILDASDTESLEVALIENLQRENLNILEEAEGYLMLADKFSLTQEQIAAKVGKARATIANAMRVVTLPEAVRQLIGAGEITAGHAKALTSLEIPQEQELVAATCIKDALSVRQLEKLIKKLKRAPRKKRAEKSDIPPEHVKYLLDKLHAFFGSRVELIPCKTFANGKKSKGSLIVDFFSNDELDRILSILGLQDTN